MLLRKKTERRRAKRGGKIVKVRRRSSKDAKHQQTGRLRKFRKGGKRRGFVVLGAVGGPSRSSGEQEFGERTVRGERAGGTEKNGFVFRVSEGGDHKKTRGGKKKGRKGNLIDCKPS